MAREEASAYISNISHEIRTAINAVLGMNELILRESTDSVITGYAKNVASAGNDLRRIADDILDHARLTAGKLTLITENYDLSELLSELIAETKNSAAKNDLVFETDIDPAIPKQLYGDPVRIGQVLRNLLTNAVDYTEEGSITFQLRFEKAAEDAVLLHVSVKDTGIGIRKEDRWKLFSEYERIEEKRNRHIAGAGLGLCITSRLLKMMGSELSVESAYGVGSEFSFTLRQQVTDWEPAGTLRDAAAKKESTAKSYREKFTAPQACVLVVDDTPMNLIVFKGLIKKTLVQVETACSGEEALKLFRKKRYDVIFLDHMMPGMDGIETLRQMRALSDTPNGNTPVICLTANAIVGMRETYLNAGFDDYLPKPVDGGRIEEMLLSYLPPEKLASSDAGERATTENIKTAAATEKPDMIAPASTLSFLSRFEGQSLLDPSAGLKNTGSEEDYHAIISIFYETMDERLAELQGYYESGDLQNYTICVHALKGSARIIGAEELGNKAEELEHAAKREDLAFLRDRHDTFVRDFAPFRDLLARLLTDDKPSSNQTDVDKKPVADEALLKQTLGELATAAEEMDFDLLEEAFSRMEAYEIPAEAKALWEQLLAAYSRFDYDEILRLCEELA